MKNARVSDILGIIGKIAPPALAESWDNPGLQVGDPAAEVSRIMVALDPGPAAVAEALSTGCQLLIAHHPLIFKPQKSISCAVPLGKLLFGAIRGGLAIASMHTNYDSAEGGLNDVLAEKLGLAGCQPLQVTTAQELVKLVVFVPEGHLEAVRAALFPLASQQGAYRDCSFAAAGEGTFAPLPGAQPFIGRVGALERVEERRLELLLDRATVPRAIRTLLAEHPYEEPAFDIYPLHNEGRKLGLGRIGRLAAPEPLSSFARRVSSALQAPGLRFVGHPETPVRSVALCSGSGASLLRSAVRLGADVLVTGDLKYHEARDAEDLGIAVVDAGHFATEIIMVDAVAGRLAEYLGAAGFEACQVVRCTAESDPFRNLSPC